MIQLIYKKSKISPKFLRSQTTKDLATLFCYFGAEKLRRTWKPRKKNYIRQAPTLADLDLLCKAAANTCVHLLCGKVIWTGERLISFEYKS